MTYNIIKLISRVDNCWGDIIIIIDVEYTYGFVGWGGLQAKSMTSQRYRATYKMADMRYYGNVMTTTRWRLYVTMETLRQQQDGGYALLLYIFNSTVVAWTFIIIIIIIIIIKVLQKTVNY